MTDRFETELASRLRLASERVVHPFDPSEIATLAASRSGTPARARPVSWVGWRPAIAIVGAMALVVALLVAMAGGARRTADLAPSPLPSPLAVAPPEASPSPDEEVPASTSPAAPVATAVPPGSSQSLPGCTALDPATGIANAEISTGWPSGADRPSDMRTDGLIAASTGGPDDADGGGVALIRPSDGASRRAVSLGPGVTTSSVRWSPDGRAVAFVASVGGGVRSCSGVFVWTEDGLSRVFTGQGGIAPPAWSPDGASLAVNVGDRLVILHADGSTPVDLGVLCPDCLMDAPVWAPDGRRIATSGLNADQTDRLAAVVSVADRTWVPLPEARSGVVDRWLDSSTVLVATATMSASGTAEWRAMDVDGAGSARRVLDWLSPDESDLSPDLKHSVWSRCLHCPLVVTSKGAAHDVWTLHGPASQEAGGATPVAWSRDSRWVIFGARAADAAQRGTWIVGADGRGLRRLTTDTPADLDWWVATP